MKKALRILFSVVLIASTTGLAASTNTQDGGPPACFYNGVDPEPHCLF